MLICLLAAMKGEVIRMYDVALATEEGRSKLLLLVFSVVDAFTMHPFGNTARTYDNF